MILGKSIGVWIISGGVYCIAVLFGTEIFKCHVKRYLDKKLRKKIKKGVVGLLLSWFIGLVIYTVFAICDVQDVSVKGFMIFVILTAKCNGGYKFKAFKKLLQKILKNEK